MWGFSIQLSIHHAPPSWPTIFVVISVFCPPASEAYVSDRPTLASARSPTYALLKHSVGFGTPPPPNGRRPQPVNDTQTAIAATTETRRDIHPPLRKPNPGRRPCDRKSDSDLSQTTNFKKSVGTRGVTSKRIVSTRFHRDLEVIPSLPGGATVIARPGGFRRRRGSIKGREPAMSESVVEEEIARRMGVREEAIRAARAHPRGLASGLYAQGAIDTDRFEELVAAVRETV